MSDIDLITALKYELELQRQIVDLMRQLHELCQRFDEHGLVLRRVKERQCFINQSIDPFDKMQEMEEKNALKIPQ